jgi:hypothetical protein
MKRVINGFAKMSIPEFSQRLKVIVTCMTGNANFTSLQTAVQALSTEASIYYELAIQAEQREKSVVLARDASRAKLTDVLHSIGYTVSGIAEGNEQILSSSGYSYTQPKKPTPPMERPAPPKLSSGVNSGEIECRTVTQPGMKSVNYYYTTDATALTADNNDAWDIASYNKTKYVITNLIPGQRYYVMVGIIGVRGQEVFSDSVSYIAQ